MGQKGLIENVNGEHINLIACLWGQRFAGRTIDLAALARGHADGVAVLALVICRAHRYAVELI
ncbi:MAG: hypothetical protein AB1925_18750 [Actinomycetota bacterium]